jgi:hypothetical protein
MTATGGIHAPDEVEQGSTTPVEVTAPGSSKLTITVSSTGEEIDVDVDTSGKATFKLPAGVLAGATLLIADFDDPTISTEIRVIPASD